MQLQELACQSFMHSVMGWALTYPLMGPIIRSQAVNWIFRLPCAMSIALFLHVQAANWMRPSKAFHEIMS